MHTHGHLLLWKDFYHALLPKEQCCSSSQYMLDWMHQADNKALEYLLKWIIFRNSLIVPEDTFWLVYAWPILSSGREQLLKMILSWLFVYHAHHPPLSQLYSTTVLYTHKKIHKHIFIPTQLASSISRMYPSRQEQ